MNRKSFVRDIFIILLIITFFLDGIELFGRNHDPEALGHFACSILPFTKVSILLISHPLVNFSYSQCALFPLDPVTSIIFFMLKITIVFVLFIVSWIFTLSVSFEKIRQDIYSDIQKNGGVIGHFKNTGCTIVGLILFCTLLLLDFNRVPSSFRVNFFNKFYENFVCAMIFITLLVSITDLLFLVLYSLKYLRAPNTKFHD